MPSLSSDGYHEIRLTGFPRQWLFLDSTEPEQLYGGAKGGGKTWALCLKALMLALQYPGNRIGLFRQDLTDLKQSLLITFRRVCPYQLIIQENLTDHWFKIYTGDHSPPSWIVYGGLGDQHEVESAKGKEFGAIGFDEPTEISISTYRMLRAQLRWRLPDGSAPPYMTFLTSNPEPGWVEEHFHDLILQASERRPIVTDGKRKFIRALPSDNPMLPESTLDFMRDMPEVWRKKYVEGSWEAAEGQVYAEFDREVHLIRTPPVAFLQSLKLVASIDHATTGVTCMAIDGIDPDGNVFALAEYYERNRLISEHAASMKQLMDKWVDACGKRQLAMSAPNNGMYPATQAFEYILIDPSTQAKTLQNRDALSSVQEEYIRHGIPTQAAWNKLDTGIDLMREYLHPKPMHIHPLTLTRGAPSLFIIGDNNPNGIRELVSWRGIIKPNGKWEYHGADHWLDNQRYIIMSRPEPPRVTAGDNRAIGDSLADTMARIAMRDMVKFDKKFRPSGADSGQWFEGGSGNSNVWWPRERPN